MIDKITIENILFLDIETAPVTYQYKQLAEETKKLWDEKFRYNEKETSESLYKKAGIYAEFAKVICISVGIIHKNELRLKSFFGDDEKKILQDFSELLNTHYDKPRHHLCAHNGKEFDFPFICRRLLINGLRLPNILNIQAKKPWDVAHLDTLELWKFGDYKNYTSLKLLAHAFGVPTPKDDIDGSDVARVYWEEKNLPRIVTYCQKDVLTVVQLFRKMRGDEMIELKNVIIA